MFSGTIKNAEDKDHDNQRSDEKVPAAEPTTPEDLECRWSKVLTFGDKIVMAGYFYNGMNKPCYFGAAYEFLTDDHTCEGMVGLRAASEIEFEDDGHAIAWAVQQ